ncbi:MAG TPA: site-specific integrase, partial [Gemmatimonadales bacterium]|nr:site-specific integrase [Gemmatimonadales bacterium]
MSELDVDRAFLLEPFADYLSLEAGNSPNTVESYLRDIRRLATFAVSRRIRRPDRVKAETVRDLVYHLKDLGFSTASIRRQIAATRTYYRFL